MSHETDQSEEKIEKWTPYVIAVLGLVLFAVATYINYGPTFHWGTSTDISAIGRDSDR